MIITNINYNVLSLQTKVMPWIYLISVILLPLQSVFAATSTMEYYHYNHQGSLIEVYDGNTNKRLLSQAWSPWGERQVLHNTTAPEDKHSVGNLLAHGLPMHMGYTGHKELLATGLVFAGDTRLYDPRLKRFLNSDDRTTGGVKGQNRYSYAYNNPMTYIDPNGRAPIRDSISAALQIVMLSAFMNSKAMTIQEYARQNILLPRRFHSAATIIQKHLRRYFLYHRMTSQQMDRKMHQLEHPHILKVRPLLDRLLLGNKIQEIAEKHMFNEHGLPYEFGEIARAKMHDFTRHFFEHKEDRSSTSNFIEESMFYNHEIGNHAELLSKYITTTFLSKYTGMMYGGRPLIYWGGADFHEWYGVYKFVDTAIGDYAIFSMLRRLYPLSSLKMYPDIAKVDEQFNDYTNLLRELPFITLEKELMTIHSIFEMPDGSLSIARFERYDF